MPTVLIVDDCSQNRFLMCAVLKKLGVKSVQAENGLEAIDQFNEHLPDLVFMDIEMPLLNGIQATLKIKDIEPDIPVVAVSSLPKKSDTSPFDFYIEKPYKIALIKNTLFEFGLLQNIRKGPLNKQETNRFDQQTN